MTLLAIGVLTNIGAMVLNITTGEYWTLPISGIAALWCSLALFEQVNNEVKK